MKLVPFFLPSASRLGFSMRAKPGNSPAVLAMASVAMAGLLLGSTWVHADESSKQPETRRLQLKVVKTLAQPVIGRNTPGAEKIPGGFEGGNTVKVTIDGKPEYHFFAHSYPKLDWSQSQLDHWVSGDGLNWRHQGVLQAPYKDEQTGLYHIFCAPIPFYDEQDGRWYLFYGDFGKQDQQWSSGGTMRCAQSKVPGPKGVYGPYDFPGREIFVPGQSHPQNVRPNSNSAPFRVKDGRWAMFFNPDGPLNPESGKWWVALSFGPTPRGPFKCPEPCEHAPLIDPTGYNENPMPIKVRGPKSGREYWVAVFDFLAPEVTAFTPKNVFGFSWSDDGVHWPAEHGQVVNVDDGLSQGERGWWRGAWAIRTPHQMIDEGDGTYTVFFTGGTHENHFADFRAVGMVKVKLIEE